MKLGKMQLCALFALNTALPAAQRLLGQQQAEILHATFVRSITQANHETREVIVRIKSAYPIGGKLMRVRAVVTLLPVTCCNSDKTIYDVVKINLLLSKKTADDSHVELYPVESGEYEQHGVVWNDEFPW